MNLNTTLVHSAIYSLVITCFTDVPNNCNNMFAFSTVFRLTKARLPEVINISSDRPRKRFTVHYNKEELDIVEEHEHFERGFEVKNHYTLPASIALEIFGKTSRLITESKERQWTVDTEAGVQQQQQEEEEEEEEKVAEVVEKEEDAFETVRFISRLPRNVRKIFFTKEVQRIPLYENQIGVVRDIEDLELRWGVAHGVPDTPDAPRKLKRSNEENEDDTMTTPKKWRDFMH